MRAMYVLLSFVLCALVIVGSCPLQQLEVNSSTNEDFPLISSSFQSPQIESVMGGYLSRARRSEDKEENSPMLETIEADQNEIIIDEKRSGENVPNADDATVREQVETCETSSCVNSLQSDETPVEVIVEEDQSSPLYPSPEELLMDAEKQDTDGQMRSWPGHSDALNEETKIDLTAQDFSEVSHPLFKTDPLEAEVIEGEVGKAEKDRNQRSSSMVVNNESELTVDVMNQNPELNTNLEKEEPIFLLRNLSEEEVIEPENDRLGSSSYRSGVILDSILIDDEPEIIVDGEVPRSVFDPSIHLMAEPVIFHPQPVAMDDLIDLELAIGDELAKRKKRTLQKSNNAHPESKASQPMRTDDEDLIDVNVGMHRQNKRARKIPRHKSLLDNPI